MLLLFFVTLITSSKGAFVNQGNTLKWFRIGWFVTTQKGINPDSFTKHPNGLLDLPHCERHIDRYCLFASGGICVAVEDNICFRFKQGKVGFILNTA